MDISMEQLNPTPMERIRALITVRGNPRDRAQALHDVHVDEVHYQPRHKKGR